MMYFVLYLELYRPFKFQTVNSNKFSLKILNVANNFIYLFMTIFIDVTL